MTDRGQRLLRLVNGLIAATIVGRAVWKRTDLPDTYVVRTSSGTVAVSGPKSTPYFVSSTLMSGYSIRVTDRSGNEVEEFGPGTSVVSSMVGVLGGGPTPTESASLTKKLEELVELIPISDSAADDVTDAILRDLESD